MKAVFGAVGLAIALYALSGLSTYYPEIAGTLKIVTINLLAPPYNNRNWYPTAAEYDVYRNDTYRNAKMIENLGQMNNVDVYMFQEVTPSNPCGADPNVFIPGPWEAISSFLGTQGFECHFAAHDSQHWSKYYKYDAEDCHEFDAYRPVGNALCVKTSRFTGIRFYSAQLSNGSAVVFADATYAGVQNLTFASIHFDSDVAGIRHDEFWTLFYSLFPPSLLRPLYAAGDYNTFWSPANLKHLYEDSGYTDVLYNYVLAFNAWWVIPPSQPLTTGWYNSNNHEHPIDHLLIPVGSAVLDPVLWDNQAFYSYPNGTRSGVMHFKLWDTYPELQNENAEKVQEGLRCGETLKQWGSDHFGVAYTLKVFRTASAAA